MSIVMLTMLVVMLLSMLLCVLCAHCACCHDGDGVCVNDIGVDVVVDVDVGGVIGL